MPVRSSGSVKAFYPRRRRDELVALLRERAEALAHVLPLKLVALFGSQATGRATAFSDVDLLVIYSGPVRDDAYSTVRRTIAVRGLEPHVYAEHEAESLGPVIDRMLRHAIRVWVTPTD
jgi:predicted nucleotidyltransferase